MTALELLTPVAPTGLFSVAWLMIVIPLVCAAILLLAGKAADSWGHWLATLAPIASFAIAVALFVSQLGRPETQRAVGVPLFTWISSGQWTIRFGMLIDPLSILFVLLITGVGSLIHVYSLGYMAHDPGRRRFFAYMNLFVTAMLILVTADDYLVLFLGWEGVGLASFLLISFWQDRPSAATAGRKAFVVNRIGDLGLTMGIFTMLAMFGSSSFASVNENAQHLSSSWVTLLGFLLLLAACGKSAQVPLQSWLLDAMEGPTPVSALIHAATMVTAGVYLVVRSRAIFELAPAAQTAVVIVGTVTLLAGAWIGASKDDIKKVLAGSTMSQIGYMMLAAGIGPAGYVFAIFHLLCHGFFKANMFLGAGSIMHAMDEDVNMRHYGALRKVLPWTFITFTMGYLAIIGFPFFSGFYSKDHIIEAAFAQNSFIGFCALVGAGVTGFYMTRLMIMTFVGTKRWQPGVHPHESGSLMVVPLVVLAVLSLIAGMVLNGWIGHWLQAAVGADIEGHMSWVPHITVVGVATLAVVAAGVALAYFWFGRREVPVQAPYSASLVTRAGRHDLYGDAINEAVFMRPGQLLTGALVALDDRVIDGGAVEGTAHTVAGLGSGLRRLQNGYVRSYALTMIVGLLAVAAALILGRLV